MGYSVAFIEQCRVDVAAKSDNVITVKDRGKIGSSRFLDALYKAGKYLLLALMFMTFSGMLAAQTYYWIGGTGPANYNDRNNWSLTVGGSRVASNPGTSNTIVFVVDGSDIGGGATGDVTITFPTNNMTNGGWRIVYNANVTIDNSNSRTLTLQNVPGEGLFVDSGSSLNMSRWGITIRNSAVSQIDGLLTLGSRTYATTNGYTEVTGTITNNGAAISGTDATLLFASNSVYNHDMNGGNMPTATWDATSTINVNGITANNPGGFNQTFGNLNINGTGITGNRTAQLSGHTVVQGDFYIALIALFIIKLVI